MVASQFYEFGTTDFYPQLTAIIAENPDVVNLNWSAPPGDQALLIKQLRELGYDGMIQVDASLPGVPGDIVSAEMAEGIYTGHADWSSPTWSDETRELYEDYCRRFPEYGGELDSCVQYSFGAMNMFAAAIERAGSTDVNEVKAALQDPGFRFNRFGYEAQVTGSETYGMRCISTLKVAFSQIRDGKTVQLDLVEMRIP
jgi:branched-chain amino acid transport system substrate-binding protein